jgi:ribosomal protein L10
MIIKKCRNGDYLIAMKQNHGAGAGELSRSNANSADVVELVGAVVEVKVVNSFAHNEAGDNESAEVCLTETLTTVKSDASGKIAKKSPIFFTMNAFCCLPNNACAFGVDCCQI